MAVTQFDLTRQFATIEDEVNNSVKEVLSSGRYIFGPYLQKFEEEFAQFLGCKHCSGVASGTDALLLSLEAAGIGKGDEVITTPFTFFATAEVICQLGAKPVFVDINPVSYNMDISQIREKVTDSTKAIIPVHLYGLSCDMDPILEIAEEYNLAIVEDTAQAAGAEYKGRKCGSLGTFGAFSFFPTKNLACCGDGGAITVNDDKLAEKIRMLRVHGSRKKYHYEFVGHNSRLDAIQAAILTVKLNHIEEWNEKRRKAAKFYSDELKEIVLQVPQEPQDYLHVFHQYTIRAKDRDELSSYLKENGIGHAIYYPVPLHLQPAMADYGYGKGDFPEAEKACQEVISLPIFPEIYQYEQEEVIDAIKSFYSS